MDSREFRNAMGKFATGITIVTTDYEDDTMGMTVNAFMSVSLAPKLIAISIDEKARMYDKLQKTGKFGISILTEDQQDLAMIFARQKEKDRDIPIIRQDGIPVIDGAIASLSCHVKETAEAGDHMIFIAEVTEMNMNEGDPIIFYSGKYRSLD
ncbi:flavin reductase family protein [Virgibacillus ihumii]|uniref:flavin reductase family protein n=1 Tax=Virgibacillus ihumii TaxID=2686091 RepID=UPI00157C67A0|nr:flavin reductase family protein [Virgibacillus ihumii]